MYDVNRIRADFPILSRQVNGKPLVYLDNGASAQKPQVVSLFVWHSVVCVMKLKFVVTVVLISVRCQVKSCNR